MEWGDDGRGRVHDDVYGFWVDNGRGVVVSISRRNTTAFLSVFTPSSGDSGSHQDLWYWTFYPYNLGKEVGYFGWLGNRTCWQMWLLGRSQRLTSDVTDWERLRVRTVNGTARSADFSEWQRAAAYKRAGSHLSCRKRSVKLTSDTHSGGAFSAGTYRWSDIERLGDRPIAYVASGSHGVWPTPGKHVYAQVRCSLSLSPSRFPCSSHSTTLCYSLAGSAQRLTL